MMKMNIRKWIYLARKISYNLLRSQKQLDEEVISWMSESDRGENILKELNSPDFYIKKDAEKKRLEEKYNWKEFIAWREQYERRRNLFWVRSVVAVGILFFLGTIGWLMYEQDRESQFMFSSEIKPGMEKASLILNDGRKIVLDKSLSIFETDSSVVLNNKNGELSYQHICNESEKSGVNVLQVPCGGEYQLILADGTKIRLNSESEIVFPTNFTTDRREVSLKGEAYFQVAPDSKKPFYVRINDYMIKVTGTSFNVSSYADEPYSMTVLVEGSVSVFNYDSTWNCNLTSGHMLKYDKLKQCAVDGVCDPKLYVSWINGEFKFRDMPLEDIMKKLSRWYNFEVVFESERLKKLRFSGAAEKYNPIEFFLKMIENVTKVHFRIDGKQIIVENN